MSKSAKDGNIPYEKNEQMSNWLGVKNQPDTFFGAHSKNTLLSTFLVGGWANAWGNEHQTYKLGPLFSFGGNLGIGGVEGHDVRGFFSPTFESRSLRIDSCEAPT